ncbi:RNA polymerase sigma factor [Alkalimonas amylolytica]|uniref:RNA polymerase sigma-70 factor, ECF subfamily n=1 Tax=Alkalimonas amylolytica TaxID=152573 RepID=A0A1H3WYU1_ALKAM|nr:RNA polymerase sigma factor [Alkalimonas amylolytica]SDZ92367.1 RNA polymerase sigma-70 factor, ECF subfamily [Alkalimonas amylolytica]
MSIADLQRLLPPLRRFCFSLTGNRADADDLLQSTVEKLLKHPTPDAVAMDSWAFRICRNLWIDEYRSRKVRLAYAAAQPEVHDSADSEQQEQQMSIYLVEEAIAKLSNEHQEVLALIAIEGMSYKKAAETLDLPLGTIMSRLARARAQLNEALQARYNGETA